MLFNSLTGECFDFECSSEHESGGKITDIDSVSFLLQVR